MSSFYSMHSRKYQSERDTRERKVLLLLIIQLQKCACRMVTAFMTGQEDWRTLAVQLLDNDVYQQFTADTMMTRPLMFLINYFRMLVYIKWWKFFSNKGHLGKQTFVHAAVTTK